MAFLDTKPNILSEETKPNQSRQTLIYTAKSVVLVSLLFILASLIGISVYYFKDAALPQKNPAAAGLDEGIIKSGNAKAVIHEKAIPADAWKSPDESTIPANGSEEMIRYGRELVKNTAKYFGPNGSVARISNGMNCQNCHLEAGTKTFGNNYSIFFASYPKKSARSGKMAEATERIADCFQRSLNGKVPDLSGKEVQAMLAYMKWVGSEQEKGKKAFGSGTEKLKYMDRAADPEKGLLVYQNKCQSCHGEHGEGIKSADQLAFVYPPLWGQQSYNDAAGMYRLSNFAGFVKNNMPYGVAYPDAQLTDEESWDVAAFVNAQPRPHKAQKEDYPNRSKKPIDAPFGPYLDGFSAEQHKYGPYPPMVMALKELSSNHQ
ncbi:c-type cytochrome [Pedobacter sp. N36a]|uniref:c-type cytochrome n=1 Tax=Pedobacter sp. N36a TaxID=2767996 RepID=UPI0016570DAF|nr:c-type cytochrome [Pedobacter sp. N36a]MBC8984539.1 c-type cytochrome [Pedobacter sp. N36a]